MRYETSGSIQGSLYDILSSGGTDRNNIFVITGKGKKYITGISARWARNDTGDVTLIRQGRLWVCLGRYTNADTVRLEASAGNDPMVQLGPFGVKRVIGDFVVDGGRLDWEAGFLEAAFIGDENEDMTVIQTPNYISTDAFGTYSNSRGTLTVNGVVQYQDIAGGIKLKMR